MENESDGTRTYLNVEDGMHEYAKRHGASFDKQRQQWFVIGEVPPELVNLVPKQPNKPANHIVAPACPRCGFHTVKLPNKKDGSMFWGCSQYRVSGCRGSVDYEEYLDTLGTKNSKSIIEALQPDVPEHINPTQAKRYGIAEVTPAVRAEIAEIATFAQKVFRSPQQSERWLTSPKVGLQGRTPIESMKSLDGCRQVKALILECQ